MIGFTESYINWCAKFMHVALHIWNLIFTIVVYQVLNTSWCSNYEVIMWFMSFLLFSSSRNAHLRDLVTESQTSYVLLFTQFIYATSWYQSNWQKSNNKSIDIISLLYQLIPYHRLCLPCVIHFLVGGIRQRGWSRDAGLRAWFPYELHQTVANAEKPVSHLQDRSPRHMSEVGAWKASFLPMGDDTASY